MNYHQTLCNIRDEKEMTNREIALACNLSASYISEVFSGKKTLTLEVIEKICNMMNVDLSTFFFKCSNEQGGTKKVSTGKINIELKEAKRYLYGN